MDTTDSSYKNLQRRNLVHTTAATPSMGLFYNSSADEHQIMFAGSNGIETYSIRENKWTIISRSLSIYDSTVVQESEDYFLSFGGKVNGAFSDDVYKFDENGCNILAHGFLSHAIQNAVVLPIDFWPDHCN